MRYLIAAAVLGLAGSSFADIINVPADYATIQAAVDAAVGGDEVVVAPGTYTGTGDQVVDMLGKAITLSASGTPEETIIDGEDERRGITCASRETAETVIDGLTITHGFRFYNVGGGVLCENSSPTITNCTISASYSGTGGGIHFTGGQCAALLTDCLIIGNIGRYGGGIGCEGSTPVLTNCLISGNQCVSVAARSSRVMSTNNDRGYQQHPFPRKAPPRSDTRGGGGVHCGWGGTMTFIGCTVSQNSSWREGGGIYVSGPETLVLIDCAVVNNFAGAVGGGVHFLMQGGGSLKGTSVCSNLPDQITGSWTDNGGNTIADVCPWYQGGCCTGNSLSCVIATEEDCEYFGHTWLGEGTTCDDSPCPSICLGDVNADGEVSVNDILTVIANWGPCP